MAIPSASGFLNLPKELRVIIYEHLLESALRPLIRREYQLYFQDHRAPTCLLQASRAVHEEIKAFVSSYRKQRPLVIVFSARSARQAHALSCILTRGRMYDTQDVSDQVSKERDDTLHNFTKTAPVVDFKYLMNELKTDLIAGSAVQLPPALDCNLTPLHAFLYFSLMKLRRSHQPVDLTFRYLSAARENMELCSELEELRKRLGQTRVNDRDLLPYRVTLITEEPLGLPVKEMSMGWRMERQNRAERSILNGGV